MKSPDLPWPAFLDLLTSTLMVFLLFSFLQSAFNQQSLELLEVQKRQQSFVEAMERAFKAEIARGDISLQRGSNFLQLTFADRVLFDPAEYRLKPSGEALIGKIRDFLASPAAGQYRSVQVEGHTDNRPLNRPGYPSNNWQLSAARAISVVELLSGSAMISAARFYASGYSDSQPIASNDSDAGRALNRRIELRIFFEDLERSQVGGRR